MIQLPADFENFFQNIYKDRWPSLLSAMLEEEKKILRPCFSNEKQDLKTNLIYHSKETEQLFASRNSEGNLQYYIMDPASILSAKLLCVCDGDQVLDMCSAPGGKGLILAEGIPKKGEIILNEPSKDRRDRLQKVVQQYAPKELRPRIFVQGKDGIKFGMIMPETFDRILVDAPCSGERHLVKSPSELKTWSMKRTKSLGQKQYGLLCSALLALKPGGVLVYSTCSISSFENDAVIERLLEKKGDTFEFLPVTEEEFLGLKMEATRYGYIALPDIEGFGPLFICRLKKKS